VSSQYRKGGGGGAPLRGLLGPLMDGCKAPSAKTGTRTEQMRVRSECRRLIPPEEKRPTAMGEGGGSRSRPRSTGADAGPGDGGSTLEPPLERLARAAPERRTSSEEPPGDAPDDLRPKSAARRSDSRSERVWGESGPP